MDFILIHQTCRVCFDVALSQTLLQMSRSGQHPGGVLGPKTDGGVPLAAETWTQKDRGKDEIWGLKDRIL